MQNITIYIGAMIMSMVCGFAFTPLIIRLCLDKGLYDMPNGRKVHKHPVPRLGGIAFVPSMLIASVVVLFLLSDKATGLVELNLWSLYFMISLFLIYFIGVIDDIIGLSATFKFVIEIAAAVIMPMSGLYINNLYGIFGIYAIPFWLGAPLTVLVLVFVSNAINLIDGIDGLAGNLSLIALMGFFILFYSSGVFYYCLLIASLIGVLIPYLYYNIFGSVERKRKIFMGDSGSLSLGFILGFLAIKYCMVTTSYPFKPDAIVWSCSLLAVPCLDVIRVFFYRLRHHQSPFHPDKNHIHHKLMACGLSQHATLAVIITLELFIIAIDVLLCERISVFLIILADITVYGLFMLAVNLSGYRRKLSVGNIKQAS